MNPLAQEIYQLAKDAHEMILTRCIELRRTMVNQTAPTNVNCAYALRESLALIEDTAKQAKQIKELLERLVCLRIIEAGNADPIKTEYCTATPDVKICAAIPTFEKDRTSYEKLMTYLGIDPVLWDTGKFLTELGEIETEVVKVNWPGFQDFITRLAAEGSPVPDGIDASKCYSIYRLLMRKNGPVLQGYEIPAEEFQPPTPPEPENNF